MKRLYHSSFSRKIHIVPLYGRLAKEEQERVFDSAPFGRKKVILSTNIAETSVTIPGITTVIDSGLAKINDNFDKYVLSMDKLDFSGNGIKHRNIIDFQDYIYIYSEKSTSYSIKHSYPFLLIIYLYLL